MPPFFTCIFYCTFFFLRKCFRFGTGQCLSGHRPNCIAWRPKWRPPPLVRAHAKIGEAAATNRSDNNGEHTKKARVERSFFFGFLWSHRNKKEGPRGDDKKKGC
ncbi:hypothetical protein [Pandoravirus japonicus]|uniref:Uncharacterized protein n=1 Tax=Pandoravirus japonicus TaxID=2823154 RepID=A0A811BQ97_9VIRU|nr:hypothetical protein [Pandoravirus japonicus]